MMRGLTGKFKPYFVSKDIVSNDHDEQFRQASRAEPASAKPAAERSGRNANMSRESCWRESVSTFSSIAGALSNWIGSVPMNVAISAWINKSFSAMPW
mgnify:CR=1 FL=1